MLTVKRVNPVARAIGVISAVVMVAGGATFAALQSQVTLTNSSISTANAELQVYNFDTQAFSNQAPGFVIDNLVPGEGVEKSFYLRNNGEVGLNITAKVPTLPGAPEGGEFGFSGYENVTVTITGEQCGQSVETNLAALNANQVALPCNPLAAGATGNSNAEGTAGNYDITFDINPNVITGDSAGVGNFDLVLTGTAVASATTE